MISTRFAQNMPGWQAFATMSRKQQIQHLKHMKMSEVKDMEELFYNILKGNVKLDASTLGKIRRYKTKCPTN